MIALMALMRCDAKSRRDHFDQVRYGTCTCYAGSRSGT